MPESNPERLVLQINADGVADAHASVPGPIALWVSVPAGTLTGPLPQPGGPAIVLHLGPPSDPNAPTPSRVLDLGGHVLLPGLVNAHTHLDLTSLGPRPHDPDRGFVPWIDMIRAERPRTPAEIEASIRRGVALSLAGGVVAVGDILGAVGGQPTPYGLDVLADSPLRGVGFVEFFGIGGRAGDALAYLPALVTRLAGRAADGGVTEGGDADGRVRAGLQPHAPNTVSHDVYAEAAGLASSRGLPLATHLAETPEEAEFVARAAGPQRTLLESLGLWDDRDLAWIGRGTSPVAWLAPVLARSRWLVAHVNDASDDDISMLARTGASVAYCPRASAYFGAPARLGPHRYREMLDAGVNVALGTDSIVNLDTPRRISVLDEARLLYHRDGVAPRTLIDMMSRRGAEALSLDPGPFEIRSGRALAGLVAVPISGGSRDPAVGVMESRDGPCLLFH